MPLSKPNERFHIHKRTIECFGYIRKDGLWDIEGHMRDVKSYDFEISHRGTIKTGEAIHDMWVRLTLDDHMLIHSAEAVTDLSPYNICPNIAVDYQKIAGIKIGAGWLSEVKKILGGVNGCVHLTELLAPMATTAFQTIWASNDKGREIAGLEPRIKTTNNKPPLLNTCHSYDARNSIVKELWPEYYIDKSES